MQTMQPMQPKAHVPARKLTAMNASVSVRARPRRR